MTNAPQFSRRALLGGSLAGLPLAGVPAWANAPAVHRFSFGDHEIVVLSDGHMTVPGALLAVNAPATDVETFLASRSVGPVEVALALNVVVVKSAAGIVLIDAGGGAGFVATSGRLVGSLAAAGIAPASIGTVVITHAHPDHILGLIDDLDGSPAFANAEHLIAATELDFWRGSDTSRFPGPLEGMALAAKRVFKILGGRLATMKPESEILPGIVALDTAGHTPGHVSLLVGGGANRLLLTADAIQNAHISMRHPDWSPRGDIDGARAAVSRRRLLARAAIERLPVLAYHIPFPGFGRIEAAGTAYRWVAAG